MAVMSMPRPPESVGAELLGELLDLVRDTESAATVARREARRAEQNRVGMLYIHSLAAMAIAPLFAVTSLSSASFAVMRQLPGAPYSPAVLLGVGGLVLGLSAAGVHRRLAFTGLTLLALWYALMATTFFASVVTWTLAQNPQSLTHAFDLLFGDMDGRPSVYAVPLYVHFSAVMVRHMITLKRKLTDARMAES